MRFSRRPSRRPRRAQWARGILCAIGCLAGPVVGGAFAQGTLTGTIRDTSGAVLPGVAVTVSVAAAVAAPPPRSAETDQQGRYRVEHLPPGRYLVEATLSGFAPHAVEVAVEGVTTHDAVLTVSSYSATVTVTATKTGVADIESTPVAMTALPARTIEQRGIHALEGLAGVVPALTVSHTPGGRALFTIRGIGTNSGVAGADPSSTVYLDGVYLARPASTSMEFLDVERVEVLRGPQGTLYGRNAVGGAIHILTTPPTNLLEATVRLTAGSTDRLRAEGALRGPLVKNRVMGSFSFLRGSRDGFVKDLDHPDHPLGGEDTWAGRGQLRVVAGPRAEVLLSGDYVRDAGVPLTHAKPIAAKPGFSLDTAASLWDVRASHRAFGRNVQQGGSAKLTLHLGPTTTLTSLTAYRKSTDHFFIDRDATERSLLTAEVPDFQRQVSQEFTVARRTPRLTWIGGAYLFDDHNYQPVEVTDLSTGVQIRPFSTIDAHAWAVFGQATYRVSSLVSVTGGLRYSDEEKDAHNTGGRYRPGTDVPAVPSLFYDFVDRAAFRAWTPRAAVQVQPSRDTLVYVSATRGFKNGGFNPAAQRRGLAYRPEFAWSYEGGIKRTAAGGRVHARAAAFYNDYDDLQVQAFVAPAVLDISNAASATVAGIEVEATAVAWHGLQVAGSIAWLDATYDAYLAVSPGNVTADVAGHRLNNAPEWSGNVSAIYERATGRRGTVSLRADASWQSRVFFSPFNDLLETQEAYALVHLRAGVEARSRRWELAMSVTNLGNREYITATANLRELPAINGRPGAPRQWSTQFTIRR